PDVAPGTRLTVSLDERPLDLSVQVVSRSEREAAVASMRARVAERAASGACEDAAIAVVRVERHRPTDWAWHAARAGRAADHAAIAACWARRAETSDRPSAVDALARAHRWDHHSPELARVGRPIAEELWREGREARAAEDWEAAYARFSALLRFQPWRAWARRYAEEARDHRLGLTDDVRIGLGGYDDLVRERPP
ncbi:MAG: hypothetical protein AAF211_27010, partial [Myxococcota bacterium]